MDEGPVREAAQGAVSRGSATPETAARGTAARGDVSHGTVAPGSATRAVARGPARPAPVRRSKLPAELVEDLETTVGPKRAPRLGARLEAARRSFERERYDEARRLLVPLAREAPGAAAVRELLGLCLYRLERWEAAAVELEAYGALTGAVDQLPVLADCHRALGRHDRVDALWSQLRDASPAGPVMAEGRIVAAGSLADRGELRAAIALLERPPPPKRVREHHLRQWYALADLYDRVGETPRARALFQRIVHVDEGFADAAVRLRTL